MRIVVLGASGFIGQHLMRILPERFPTAEIVAVARSSSAHLSSSNSSIRILKSPIGRNPELVAACKDAAVIVHLAWSTSPFSSNLSPVLDVEENLISNVVFLDALSAQFRGRLVFVSSGGAVYGKPVIIPVPESHPINPITSYGISKFSVEEYISLYSTKWGFEYSILRVANPYGPAQELKKGQGVIPAILNSLLKNEPFVMWGDGSAIRDYIHVYDVMEAVLAAVENPKASSNRYNIGSGKGNSILELLGLIEKLTHRKVLIDQRPARGSDIPTNVLDISKAAAHLDWRPRISLEEGLQETMAMNQLRLQQNA